MLPESNGETIAFSINGVRSIDHSYGKSLSLDLYFILYTKINLKWIIDLNEKENMTKLLEHKNTRG